MRRRIRACLGRACTRGRGCRHSAQSTSPVVIRGHQRSSEVIRGHQRSSRGHQRSSEVIRGHQRSSEVIRGHPRSSEVIRGHRSLRDEATITMYSAAISRTQSTSELDQAEQLCARFTPRVCRRPAHSCSCASEAALHGSPMTQPTKLTEPTTGTLPRGSPPPQSRRPPP